MRPVPTLFFIVLLLGVVAVIGSFLLHIMNTTFTDTQIVFQDKTLIHDDLEREYIVGIPERELEKSVPLLVVLHGGGSSAMETKEMTDFEKSFLSFEESVVIAYPQGNTQSSENDEGVWNAKRCCDIAVEEEIDDAGFLNDMVADIARTVPIRSVSVVGFSNGAMMGTYWACNPESPVDFMVSVDGGVKVMENCERRDWSGIFLGFNNVLKPIKSNSDVATQSTSTPQTQGGWDTSRFKCEKVQGSEQRTRTQIIDISGYYNCPGNSFKEIWNLSHEHAWPSFVLYSKMEDSYESFEEWLWQMVP